MGQRRRRPPTNGDREATLHLKRPQPRHSGAARLGRHADLSLPCLAARRCAPIRSAPARSNSSNTSRARTIRFARNPDYWKPGRPYLDGVEYTIIPNRSTAILGFIAGKFDMTFPYEVTIPLLKDIETQLPQAICQVGMASEIDRRAGQPGGAAVRQCRMCGGRCALTLDRKSFIDILGQGEGEIGGALHAAARRRLGNAARNAADIARLRRRTCRRTARKPAH